MKTSEAHVMKRLLTYMWRYKWLTALALAFTFLTSLLLTAIPLAARWYIDHLVDPTEAGSPVMTAFQFLILYYGLFIGRVLATYLSQLTFARVSNSIVRDIRLDIFKNLQRLGMSFYDQTAAGSIVSRVTNDTQAVADMFSTVFSSLVSSFLLFLVTLVTMFSLDWHLTIWILPFLPIIWFSIRLYRKLSNRLVKMTRQKLSDINVKLSESIEGMRIVQAFRQEKRLTDEFEQINGEHLDYANRSVDVNSLFLRPAMTLLQVLAYAVILTFFGLNWQSSGFTAGLIYAFIQYVNQLFQPLIDVTQNFATLQTSTISAGRVFEMMDRDDYEPKQAGSLKEIERGDIRFDHVYFSYDGSDNYVLRDITWSLQEGEFLGIAGPSGGGKSTMMQLLLGFETPTKGTIRINGKDVQDMDLRVIRQSIGYVFQDSHLFKGSIKDNISLFDDAVSLEMVQAAAEKAHLHASVQRLEAGYETPVGYLGSLLSQGQRQLLSLARTLVQNKSLLVFDEATSNIDSHTEELLQQSIRDIKGEKTMIAIAHRLSTLRDATKIIVISEGAIVESGTLEEVLENKGLFYSLWNA